MNGDYTRYVQYGIKIFDGPAYILPQQPYLSLPVADLRKVSKRAAKIARKFNYEFRDQIDGNFDKRNARSLKVAVAE